MKIDRLSASEILDSRGIPALEVAMGAGGRVARASVPSGTSTGRKEAVELRDGDRSRYGGRGLLRAVFAVESEIGKRLLHSELPPQEILDDLLIDLDGTPDKSRLGANTILGVSLAAARLRALLEGRPLYRSLGGPGVDLLPVPCFNVLNGGAHANNPLEFEEFMVVPAGRPTFTEALRAGVEVYHALAGLLEARGLSTAVGDEGGFAPRLSHPAEALDLLVEAIREAGYGSGQDVFIAVDAAASTFHRDGRYRFAGEDLDAEGMVALYGSWLRTYPILSLEDGLAEDDLEGWALLTRELGHQVQLVGDDLFASDPARVAAAITARRANAVLLRPNQIGTVSEIARITRRVGQAGGFRCMMGNRSGETPDDFIADLAVALQVGQIKAGAPARERVAKYNRLLRIEQELGPRARFDGRLAFGVW